jgi:U3 small nucleolar RNA-associated protein 23
MKLKRAKRARKILSFLRSAHGFKPPFDVLVDGTAIQASLNHGVALPDALPKVLGGNVRLLVPRAVVAELHVLGRKFAAAAKTARRLKVIDDDAAAASAADALVALVADGNARRRFVMTEDTDVRQRLAQLPAVPLLRFARSQIVVELPGGRAAVSQPAAPTGPAGADRAPGASTPGSTPAGEAASAAPAAAAQKKRKRVVEPNPLSCKKKQRQVTPPPPTAKDSTGPHKSKATRRGRRRGEAGAASQGAAPSADDPSDA